MFEHKITDLKYKMKGLIPKNICQKLPMKLYMLIMYIKLKEREKIYFQASREIKIR